MKIQCCDAWFLKLSTNKNLYTKKTHKKIGCRVKVSSHSQKLWNCCEQICFSAWMCNMVDINFHFLAKASKYLSISKSIPALWCCYYLVSKCWLFALCFSPAYNSSHVGQKVLFWSNFPHCVHYIASRQLSEFVQSYKRAAHLCSSSRGTGADWLLFCITLSTPGQFIFIIDPCFEFAPVSFELQRFLF